MVGTTQLTISQWDFYRNARRNNDHHFDELLAHDILCQNITAYHSILMTLLNLHPSCLMNSSWQSSKALIMNYAAVPAQNCDGASVLKTC